jgi:glycosyltransferase involved in cell wall biosynthesis
MEELADIRVYGLTQPVALLPNGIDVQPMDRLHSGPRRRTILSLGRIHPKKGLVTLIESWASLEADFPDWDLRIVGPDERGHKAELRDHCRRIGLKRVRIEEPVFGEEKTRLMSSVSLFALPTRSENFAMTVAESLAAGTPVISSKGAPWHGLETNRCGWWVDHGAASFSAALRRAMSLPEAELQAMGLRGREWMERDFSWNRIAAAMLEAYDWGLNGGPIPAHVHVG